MELTLDSDLVLQRLRSEHAPALFALTKANQTYLRHWLPWLDLVQTEADSAQFIRSVTELYHRKRGVQFGIVYRETLSGLVGFNRFDDVNRQATIGYWLAQEQSGRGIMTRCVAELVRWGFVECDLNRIEIRCAEHNIKSRAIPERLSFKREGLLRQCEWLYDHYVDHVLYALLAEEYRFSLG